MATESAREARRKRILDRGTDRFAFITGQARSPPEFAVSTPAASPPKQGGGGGETEESPLDPVGAARGLSNYELPKCEPSGTNVRDAIDKSAGIDSFPGPEKTVEAVATVQRNNEQIRPGTPQRSRDQVVHNEPQRAKRQVHEMFTAKRISSSIATSENIRTLCATVIALVVVLACHGFSLGIGSIISFRPIFLVFLTDVTLVVWILFTNEWEERGEVDTGTTSEESRDWADQVGIALETALTSQKVATALFLDCSICAVIIICGTSFNRTT